MLKVYRDGRLAGTFRDRKSFRKYVRRQKARDKVNRVFHFYDAQWRQAS